MEFAFIKMFALNFKFFPKSWTYLNFFPKHLPLLANKWGFFEIMETNVHLKNVPDNKRAW